MKCERYSVFFGVGFGIRAAFSGNGQAGTFVERPVSNACDAVRNGDGGQAGAAGERRFSNACDAVRNGDGGQAGAATKRPVSNACDTVLYNNGFYVFSLCMPWTISNTLIYTHISAAADDKQAVFIEFIRNTAAAGAAGNNFAEGIFRIF